MLGNFAFVEAMLDDVLRARDAHLAQGGRMLPARIDAMLSPIDDPVLFAHEGPGFWRTPVLGLDFSMLEATELEQAARSSCGSRRARSRRRTGDRLARSGHGQERYPVAERRVAFPYGATAC